MRWAGFLMAMLAIASCDQRKEPARDAAVDMRDGAWDAVPDASYLPVCDDKNDCGTGEWCCTWCSPGGACDGPRCGVPNTQYCEFIVCPAGATTCIKANGEIGGCAQIWPSGQWFCG